MGFISVKNSVNTEDHQSFHSLFTPGTDMCLGWSDHSENKCDMRDISAYLMTENSQTEALLAVKK